jgi:cobalt/nickel transport protein
MSYAYKKMNTAFSMSRIPVYLICVFIMFFTILGAYAHFGMIIPSKSFIDQASGNKVELDLSFSHPFAYKGMNMNKPQEFGVFFNGKKHNLTNALKKKEIMKSNGWTSTYTVKRPAVYQFYMVPDPYWEPAEEVYIQHITKVVVPAYGMEDGWDNEIGLKTEIVPLTRPFGIYAGNTFQGIVKVNGKISPDTLVEVVYYNIDNEIKVNNPYLEMQYVKTDANGIFTYTPPAPGWWGFAALTVDKEMKSYHGKDKNVELGAIIWVKFATWDT